MQVFLPPFQFDQCYCNMAENELQSQIGTLNFACKVVPPGRPFLQLVVELTRNVSQPHHHIKLSSGFFKDVQTWKTFISQWNGAAFLINFMDRLSCFRTLH